MRKGKRSAVVKADVYPNAGNCGSKWRLHLACGHVEYRHREAANRGYGGKKYPEPTRVFCLQCAREAAIKAECQPGWHFWQIDGWNGVWSKYHWLTPQCRGVVVKTWSAQTACGRFVHPEAGGDFVRDRNGESKDRGRRCKSCERVLATRGSDELPQPA